MELCDLDPLTLSLVVQMHLEDAQLLADKAKQKGKGRDGETSDLLVAIESYRDDLSCSAQILSDRAMSRSICRAVDLDADAIRAWEAEEERAARDRDMALRLSGINPNMDRPGAANPRRGGTPAHTEYLSEKLKALYIGPAAEDDPSYPGQAESSSWAATRRQGVSTTSETHKNKNKKCIACGDDHHYFDIASCTGCTHEYCRECLRSLFEACLTDETLFPPRCCGGQIPLDACRPLLPAELIGRFQAKKIEFDTPNRTYCHKPACSTFVPPQAIKAGEATCLRCRATTCAVCKGAAHADSSCPEDPATQELLRVARECGWQRCYNCARFVELQHGCNHITCRCGAQFCYVCGNRWKTCTCPQWEEARLLDRANAIVQRNAGAAHLAAGRRANLVERARRNLVANHECQHTMWGSRQGRNRCEECHDTLHIFIYECLQCRILACRRCRYNRFT